MPHKLTNNYTTETRSRIKKAHRTVLVCDYDGTLVPLPQGAEDTHMAETVHDHILKISEIPSVDFAVISGRTHLDLREKLNLPGCHLISNHGFEIQGPDVNFHHSIADKCRDAIHSAASTLRIQLRIDRVVIEDRGMTASVNYREVMESQVSSLLAKCRNLLASAVRDRQIRIEEGRRTLEITPAVDWDRGKAVKMLVQNYRAIYPDQEILLLYVGDDAMDEPAFKYARQVGIPYRVTQTKETDAIYYLKMQTEISRVLKIVRESAHKKTPEPARETVVL